MRNMLLMIMLMVSFSSFAAAQTAREHKGQGYVVAAPGVSTPAGYGFTHIAGGAEGFVYRGLSVGAEIGGIIPFSDPDEGFGIFSPNVSYHFRDASKSGNVVPFVTGGYSLYFREGTASAVNFGGGLHYWFSDRIGLRFEVRDNVAVQSPEFHLIGFRVGVAFR